jgi:hypothetical protein
MRFFSLDELFPASEKGTLVMFVITGKFDQISASGFNDHEFVSFSVYTNR